MPTELGWISYLDLKTKGDGRMTDHTDRLSGRLIFASEANDGVDLDKQNSVNVYETPDDRSEISSSASDDSAGRVDVIGLDRFHLYLAV